MALLSETMDLQLQFVCNFCDSSSERLTDMEQLHHIRMEHFDQYKPYKCVQCDLNFPVEPMFSDHALTRHNNRSMTADSRISSQFLNVLGDMMMQCSFYNAIGQKQIATKLISAVKQSTIQPKVIQKAESDATKTVRLKLACEFCPKTFSRPSALRLHEDSSHNSVSTAANRCVQCDRRYNFPSVLRLHLQSAHKSSKPVRNHKAQKRAMTLNLGRHSQRAHTATKPATSSIADCHLKSKLDHSKTRPPCQHCPLTFDNMSEWRKHQDSKHKTVSKGPYKCSECGNRFYNYSNYQRCHPDSPHKEHCRARINKKTTKFSKIKPSYTYWCVKCRRSLNCTADNHVATFHIKKRVVGCSECDYKNCWNTANVRRHIDTAHQGSGSVIDQRASIAREAQQLAREIIKRSDKRTAVKMKRAIEREKWAHCSQCKLSMNMASIRHHLSSAKHIGKHCLKCEGCSFSTYFHVKRMKNHLNKCHAGENIGFVDKRYEIEGRLKRLIKQCITFHQNKK